ncbi:MAG: WD40 repeat domain-containing protein [Bacteroidia bacterium]|nr:WD40 repeat domain-containing protein [Bacteroidia bacterium]MBP9688904.1 WD40 repeat domain-containing protein [Bacteroidia bacterium]
MKYILTIITTLIIFPLLAQSQNEPITILKGHTNDVDAVAISKLGFIATGSFDQNINIYNADSPFTRIKTITGGHMGPVNVLEFSSNGKILASGSEDRVIVLWDSIFREKTRLEGHKDKVNCLIFDIRDRYLYSGSDDKTIMVWNLKTGKAVKTINNGNAVNAIAPTKNIQHLYVAGAEPKIKIYHMLSNKVIKTLDGHTDAVNDIELSNDGKWLVSGSNDKTARIWSVATGKQVRILPVDCWKVTTVNISKDSKYVTTGCNDGSIKVWELETGKLLHSIDFSGSIARNVMFGKTSQQILAAFMLRNNDDYGLRVYDSKITLTPINVSSGNGVNPTDSSIKNTVQPQKNQQLQNKRPKVSPKPSN